MAALTTDRNTPERSGDQFSFPVAASTTIFAGSICALNASGYAVPGATSTTLIAVGRAEEQIVNSGSAGAVSVNVKRGVFRFGNSASADLIARANIGSDCYIVDDQTVALTSGTNTRSVAGVIVDVDDVGVWVRIGK